MRTWQGLLGLLVSVLGLSGVGAMVWALCPPGPLWRGAFRVASWLVALAAGTTGLLVTGLAFWSHPQTGKPPADRWLNVMTGLGATAAFLAFLGAAYLAARYGRRASISITADIAKLPGGDFVISARPEVNAVGLFRVKFHGPSGAVIRVREVHAVDQAVSATGLWEGQYRLAAAIFGEEGDTQQFAESGEALQTTVLFRVPAPEGVIGWMVVVSVRAPTRWMPGSSGAWGDKVFLPKPESKN